MITEPEWASIRSMVESVVLQLVGDRRSYFTTGKVTKVDTANKCVFIAELGDQPIPVVAFNRMVKYYDEGASGAVTVKREPSEITMPTIGQSVLIAKELGSGTLPRCLGVIQGTNWIVPEDE